jgi:hypothetical protein
MVSGVSMVSYFLPDSEATPVYAIPKARTSLIMF